MMEYAGDPKLPEQKWAETARYYERAITEYGWPQYQPMLEFVNRLSSTKCSEVLFPSTSMLTLVISMIAIEPWLRPQVKITYIGKDGFHLEWCREPGVRVIKEQVDAIDDQTLIARILAWLDVPQFYATSPLRRPQG